MSRLTFEALYYGDRLLWVNPTGDVGVVTLWSDVAAVRRHLAPVASEVFDPASSRVAVVANLYGDGMYAMFCNLLYNPQVRHLVALGHDRGQPTCEEIEAFLAYGVEDDVMLGRPVKRIAGMARVFPANDEFDVPRLRENVTFRYLGRLDAGLPERLVGCLNQLPTEPPRHDRLRVPLSMSVGDEHVVRPSDISAHQVVRRRPLECWKELVVRVVRFGRVVRSGHEERLELQNVKAVITEPQEEPAEVLAKYGFDLARFQRYAEALLRPDPPDEGIAYTYGHRLFGYFPQLDSGTDTLATVVEHLRRNVETRHGYVALWDTAHDLPVHRTGGPQESPCLTSLFFRRADDRLGLSATFRVHNLLRAWLENVYGLLAIQRHVADQLAMEAGPLSVISHSLGVNPAATEYERARSMADGWVRDDDYDEISGKYSLRPDPHGNFVVSVDRSRGRLVVEHWAAGILLRRYEGDRAERLAREIAGDMAVSLPSHALWLGRELAEKEHLLRTGEP